MKAFYIHCSQYLTLWLFSKSSLEQFVKSPFVCLLFLTFIESQMNELKWLLHTYIRILFSNIRRSIWVCLWNAILQLIFFERLRSKILQLWPYKPPPLSLFAPLFCAHTTLSPSLPTPPIRLFWFRSPRVVLVWGGGSQSLLCLISVGLTELTIYLNESMHVGIR